MTGRESLFPARDPLTEEGGVNESSSGVHGQQMSPLRSPENDRSGRSFASTSPPAASGSSPLYECPDCGNGRDCSCDEPDGYELDCTHCGGDGTCDDNADPLWDCDEIPHPCHACGGSGNRRDQRIF